MTMTCLRASGAVISLTSDSNVLQRNTAKLFVPCYFSTCLGGQLLGRKLWQQNFRGENPTAVIHWDSAKQHQVKKSYFKQKCLFCSINCCKMISTKMIRLVPSPHFLMLFLHMAIFSYLFHLLKCRHLSSGIACKFLIFLSADVDETFGNAS